MLSKKMTFSLMSLITLLAFAFVAPSAMAGFGASFNVDDVSLSDTNDVEAVGDGAVDVYIKFDEVVTLTDVRAAFGIIADGTGGLATATDKSGSVDILNYYGAVIDEAGNVITITGRNVDALATNARNDGKNFTITIAAVPRPAGTDAADKNTDAATIRLFLAVDAVGNADPNSDTLSNKIDPYTVTLVGGEQTDTDPDPVSIALAPGMLIPAAGFKGATFDVIVTLSENPKEGAFPKALLTVAEGAASDGVFLGAIDAVDGPDTDTNAEDVTGRDGMHHQFLVTITPTAVDGNTVIELNAFEDDERYTYDNDGIDGAGPNEWAPPASDFDRVAGMDTLTVKINRALVAKAKLAGIRVAIPKDKVIPAGGYLIVAESKDGSAIIAPATDDDATPDSTKDAPAQLTYKIVEAADIPNLETLLNNGGVIDVEGPPALVISEIMWGSDASLVDPADSQWIELYNAGAEYKTVDDDAATDANEAVALVFYGPADTLPAIADVNDRVGTIDVNGAPWSVGGKGQSGRTGTGEEGPDIVATVPTERVISMQRAIATDGTVSDGQDASSWTQSAPPGLNFKADAVGIRVANPGTGSFTFADPVVDVEDEEVTVPVAMREDIMITEIMVDTGNGRLPQWIELTNVSGKAASLAGWSLQITNSDADDDVIGGLVSINLSGTLGVGGGEDAGGTMGKSLLLVAGVGNRSNNLDESDRVVDVSSQLDQKGRYTLISTMAFMAALVPPQTTGILTYGDTAGNLDEGWELPTSERDRSSLIRREADAAGMATMGTAANGWALASDTALVSGPATWYGSDKDAGTPGYDSGGPLPVSLSHFRPARDRDTGAAVITWSTQSELNNAGFFIKRSQQRDGQFKVINAAMVQGAGTTSEKQFYTYTDTTAQPNVVYYYQIEDVSLDGNRQTLTNGIRLKGHIGAAGKLTTTWGDLKTSQ